jgi:acetyl-CoA acyltransferase
MIRVADFRSWRLIVRAGEDMREAVVVASTCTGLAKSFRGSFNITRPEVLAAHCIKDVLRNVPQLDVAELDDVVLGCSQPHGPQSHNITRTSAMLAGLPTSVASTTINRFCSSGLQAIAVASHQIISEGVEAAIGGGVESISMTPAAGNPHPELQKRLPGLYLGMGDTAEIVAKRYQVSREVQDEYALLSQQRTAHAQREGLFEGEIAPMKVTMALLDKKTGEKVGTREVCCDHDECNRPDTTLEGLLAPKPHFDPHSREGTVTDGNSSQLSDGASATLLMSRQRTDQLGVPYKLVFRGFQVAGCNPDEMGIGPVFAVPKLLKRTGLEMDDIGPLGTERGFCGAGDLLPRPPGNRSGES